MDSSGSMAGYEFRFSPDGTVDYREGYTQEISDNIAIKTVTSEASGTWSSLGNMTYLREDIARLRTAGGAPIIRQYTLVPAHENKDYPGVVIPTHIERLLRTQRTHCRSSIEFRCHVFPRASEDRLIFFQEPKIILFTFTPPGLGDCHNRSFKRSGRLHLAYGHGTAL